MELWRRLALDPAAHRLVTLVGGGGKTTLLYALARQAVDAGYGIVIPAGAWHNLVNTGCDPLQLVSVYAPPQHPFGTVHKTKADADASEA